MKRKPTVAFICVHNSCRSQIGEALGKLLGSSVFESFSAGTHQKDCIQPDAIRLMKKLYAIDMEETQAPKTLDALPNIDIVITMGCNVQCPTLPCLYREDWGLDDPTGKSDDIFLETIHTIHTLVENLITRITNHELP